MMPAVYFNRLFVEAGGLISYGADTIDPLRRAANYVDRILKGEKPADLPVQAPTKYELVINQRIAGRLRSGSHKSDQFVKRSASAGLGWDARAQGYLQG
jgi:ABC-type uncharacterized transport system substrate-binding protein